MKPAPEEKSRCPFHSPLVDFTAVELSEGETVSYGMDGNRKVSNMKNFSSILDGLLSESQA